MSAEAEALRQVEAARAALLLAIDACTRADLSTLNVREPLDASLFNVDGVLRAIRGEM